MNESIRFCVQGARYFYSLNRHLADRHQADLVLQQKADERVRAPDASLIYTTMSMPSINLWFVKERSENWRVIHFLKFLNTNRRSERRDHCNFLKVQTVSCSRSAILLSTKAHVAVESPEEPQEIQLT